MTKGDKYLEGKKRNWYKRDRKTKVTLRAPAFHEEEETVLANSPQELQYFLRKSSCSSTFIKIGRRGDRKTVTLVKIGGRGDRIGENLVEKRGQENSNFS